MKKHTAIEHGGNLSRSKRNAILQIPTSFRFWRIVRDRHGRGRGSQLGLSDKICFFMWSVLLPVVLTLIATRTKDSEVLKAIAEFCYPKWAFQAFVIGNAERWTMTVASVGDSRCILDTQGGVVSTLTVDHRLEENVEKRERVITSGGEVGKLNIVGGA